MSALDLARHAFWSDHPLCALYAIAHGAWQDGAFRPADSWSLRDLIRFAQELPEDIIRRLAADGRSAPPVTA